MKFRIKPPKSPLHVVLIEPEIPQNTGAIARLCAATSSTLHLVGKLGFSIDEKAVRRAGLDYWHLVTVKEHPDLSTCLKEIGSADPPLLFTTKSNHNYVHAPYRLGNALVFGKETKGLPPRIMETYSDRQFSIPTVIDSVRSLNLANAVSIVVYEALRNTGALDETANES
jgi:tRNA (cytidine/uridine-2'-O-)-methyltransferase